MGYVEGEVGMPTRHWAKRGVSRGLYTRRRAPWSLSDDFKVAWKNIGKIYDDQYRKAADMEPNMDYSDDQVVAT